MDTKQIFGLDNMLKYIEKNETDHYRFAYKDFVCSIKRHPMFGHLCGYLEVNPLQFDLKTVSEVANEHFHCGVSYNRDDTVGFDCNHLGDTAPFMERDMELQHWEFDTYKTVEYVKRNLFDTVDAIIESEECWRDDQTTRIDQTY